LQVAHVNIPRLRGIGGQDGQQLDPVLCFGPKHYFAYGAGVGRGEQRGAGRRDIMTRLQRQTVKMAFELAQVLHAGDDFLAGIATFFEADTAHGLQVDHLRNKQFAGLGHDLANACAYLAQQPFIEIGLNQLRFQVLDQAFGLLHRSPQLSTVFGGANGDQIAGTSNAVGFGRQVQAQALQYRVRLVQAKANPVGAVVGQFGFGKHRVFFQVCQLGFNQLASHRQQTAVVLQHDAKTGLHAAFLRAAGPQARAGFTQVVEVAGQLALQKLAGVVADHSKNAFVVQSAEKSRVGHGSSQVKNVWDTS